MDFEDFVNENQKTWNKWTPTHINSKFYNNEEFKMTGNSLHSIELNALNNIKNKTLLHLQCHFGQDSISLAKKGANVTAVDFSSASINEAKKLSKLMGIKVNFILDNILNFEINQKFDLVFSSYGVVGWIPDLDRWAKTISKHLKKGGVFVLTEFHPFYEMIKDKGNNYFYTKKPEIEIKHGSYVDSNNNFKTKTFFWNHSLTDIFGSLEANGMKLCLFEEFNYCPFPLPNMIKIDDKKYLLQKRAKLSTPYIFNLKAEKK